MWDIFGVPRLVLAHRKKHRQCRSVESGAWSTVSRRYSAAWSSDPLGALRIALAREVTNPGLKQQRFSGISTSARPDVSNGLSLDSVESLTLRSLGRVFYDLTIIRRWTGTCNA